MRKGEIWPGRAIPRTLQTSLFGDCLDRRATFIADDSQNGYQEPERLDTGWRAFAQTGRTVHWDIDLRRRKWSLSKVFSRSNEHCEWYNKQGADQ